MTIGDYITWASRFTFIHQDRDVFISFSKIDEYGKGIISTKDLKGRENSCFYWIEQEPSGELFLSYMDKEYLVEQLPDKKGFTLHRENCIDIFYIVEHE